MIQRILLSIAIVLAALFFFLREHKTVKEEVLRPVRVLKLEPVQAQMVRTFNGVASSDVAATLSFNVSGTVKKVYVKAGQSVKKGDLIAKLDDSFLKLKVDEVKASLKQAKSEYIHAKNSYDRIQRLYVHRNSSLNDLENARTAADSTKAQYNAMKKRLEQAKLELGHAVLRAPMKGSISSVNIRRNENISTATPVATISSTKTIDVSISIPGSLIDMVNEGMYCEVKFDAIKKQVFKAQVIEVSHTTSMKTTTFPVKVRILKPSRRIHPGMSASVTFRFKSGLKEGSYIVPAHIVMEDPEGRFIYVAEPDENGTAVIERRFVTTGALTSNGLIITGGVRQGLLAVTAGMSRLHEGQRVKVPEL